MKAAEKDWIEQNFQTIDQGLARGNSKEAYNTLKTLSKTSQPKTPVIEDKDGHLLTDNETVLKRWTEYSIQPATSILEDTQRTCNTEASPCISKEGQTGSTQPATWKVSCSGKSTCRAAEGWR